MPISRSSSRGAPESTSRPYFAASINLRFTLYVGVGPVSSSILSAELLNAILDAVKVYPVGIPLLYALILWKNRDLLNPRIYTAQGGANGAAAQGDSSGDESAAAVLCITSKSLMKSKLSPQEEQELEEKVQARRENPELVPSMFLWKDFGKSSKRHLILYLQPGCSRVVQGGQSHSLTFSAGKLRRAAFRSWAAFGCSMLVLADHSLYAVFETIPTSRSFLAGFVHSSAHTRVGARCLIVPGSSPHLMNSDCQSIVGKTWEPHGRVDVTPAGYMESQ